MIAVPLLPDNQDWTLDDVASLPEDLHYDLINGRLIVWPPALPIHQWLGARVGLALQAGCPESVAISAWQSVVVDNRNEPRPDVVLLRVEGANRTPVLAADVLLVVEVLSADSAERDRHGKMELYARAEIPAYWIIDPLGGQITFTEWLLSDDGSYHQHIQTDGRVTIDCPWETTLDLREWTRRRDRIDAAARPNG